MNDFICSLQLFIWTTRALLSSNPFETHIDHLQKKPPCPPTFVHLAPHLVNTPIISRGIHLSKQILQNLFKHVLGWRFIKRHFLICWDIGIKVHLGSFHEFGLLDELVTDVESEEEGDVDVGL